LSKPATQAERLTRIETLLEGWVENRKDDRAEWAVELKRIHDRLEKIEAEHRATNERLTAYENKGKGLLIGAGIAGAGVGTGFFALWEKLKGFLL
jgi:hypothetical protein